MINIRSLFCLLLVAFNVSAQTELKSIPVDQTSFKPSKTVKASYAGSDKNRTIVASFILNTFRPTLNLDNYAAALDSIYCRDNIVIVTAQLAIKSWGSTPNLALFLGHERTCESKREVHLVGVTKFIAGGNSLRFETEELKAEDLIKDYDLKVVQTDSVKLPSPNNINFNWDPIKQKVINPSIKLLSKGVSVGNVFPEISCLDCYAKGSISVEFSAKGGMTSVSAYSMSILGDIKVNLDLAANLTGRDSKPLFSKDLIQLPIGSPFYVPGVLNFGPLFELKAGLSYSLAEPLQIQFGFDMDIPINIQLGSKNSKNEPTIQTSSTPYQMNSHKVKASVIQPMQDVTAHLVPSVSVGFSIFGYDGVKLAVSLANNLGVQAKPVVSTAKDVEPMICTDLSLYHAHTFSFAASVYPALSWQKDFFSTGRIPIMKSAC